MNEKQKLSRGIIYILIANIINLVFNLLSTFVMPKYLSTDTYAEIKTYTMYLSYAGLFHLGYADGMYLVYGGKDIKSIGSSELGSDLSTMRIFQLIVSVVLLIGSILIKNPVCIMFAVSVLPYNMASYFKNLYQAVGQFRNYGKILNLTSIFLFVVNMSLLFLVKTDTYIYYLIGNVAVYIIVWIMLEINIRQIVRSNYLAFSIKLWIENIKNGILLMLGTFSSILFTSMDRWFVKIFFTNLEFAQYSFDVSAETFLDMAVSPISVTLYNFFCKCEDHDEIKRIKRYVLIFASFIISAGFGIRFILDHWIEKYIASEAVIFILFSSQLYFIVIRSIYINLYKARKRQNQYFIKMSIVIVLGLFSNYFSYRIFGNKEAFAIATLFCAVVWFILCQIDLRDQAFDFWELLFIIFENILFLGCGHFFTAIPGFLIYLGITFIVALVLLRKDFINMLALIPKMIKKRRR